ncbi:MAG TPA: DUF4405 domain-containing protein [Rhizomicrobium sp.]
MNDFLRTYATPLSFVTFLGCTLTGLLLLFGIRSRPLGEVHEWLGIVFVVALVLHLARNWRGVTVMLTAPRARLATGIGAVLVALYILSAAPFQSGHGHGRNITEMPIARMAPALGLSSDEAVARLKRGGVPVSGPQDSLQHLVHEHGQNMPRLLELLVSDKPA